MRNCSSGVYEGLGNLVGCRIRNTDEILPEHQDIRVGDEVRLEPVGFVMSRRMLITIRDLAGLGARR